MERPLQKHLMNLPPCQKQQLRQEEAENDAKMTEDTLQCIGICGATYFYVVTTTVMVTSLCYTMPMLYDNDDDVTFWTRVVVAFFVFFGIVANFVMVTTRTSIYLPRADDDGGGTLDLPAPDWFRCGPCDQVVPPRTHHCVVCRRCILFRDHHCFFTGSCIGLNNQRYFVLFCVYVSVGSAYGLYVNTAFLATYHVDPFSAQFYHLLLPVSILEWILGYRTFGFVYFVVVQYVATLTMFGSGGIAAWELFVIASGQTTYDLLAKGRRRRNKSTGVWRNLRSVLGANWFFRFLFPFPVDEVFDRSNNSSNVSDLKVV